MPNSVFTPYSKTVLHIGDQLPLNGGGVDLCQPAHYTDLVQEVEKIMQHRPFIQG
jgi:hypothetical protein